MSQKQLSYSFVNKVYDNYNKVFYVQKNKKGHKTWKPLLKRKSTFLSKLDLSEAVT